jgi:hypothetical protein
MILNKERRKSESKESTAKKEKGKDEERNK